MNQILEFSMNNTKVFLLLFLGQKTILEKFKIREGPVFYCCSQYGQCQSEVKKSTTTASKYIPKRPRICINWNPPFQFSRHPTKSLKLCFSVLNWGSSNNLQCLSKWRIPIWAFLDCLFDDRLCTNGPRHLSTHRSRSPLQILSNSLLHAQ